MNNTLKKFLLLSVMLFAMMTGYSQSFTLETNIERIKYRGSKPSRLISVQVGYQINDIWNIGMEFGKTTTHNDIRMPDRIPSGTFGDLLGLNVYKRYNRDIYILLVQK